MYIDIDGLNINYTDEGNGKSVLLLHGWGGSIQTMMAIGNILKDKFRVISVDLPGFGKSGIPEVPWDSYDYAECIYKFIQKLNLSGLIVFGHSHGGRISIILASKYEVVRKLILIDSAGIIPKRKAKYYKENKEHIIERVKEYNQKNKERLRKYKAEYYQKNKEEIERKRKARIAAEKGKTRAEVLAERKGKNK